MYNVTTLPNGLRVATAEMPCMESVALGLWIGVGGRCENKQQSGISHFIEHLLFKGTRRRSARQISQTVEGIGGYLNAFTGEEHTCYYAKASHRHFATLLDVLADMYSHPRFAAADIRKERGVIKEELLMYRDQPDHHAQELLTDTLWPNQPLGRPLTGSVESLDAIHRAGVLAFKNRNYTAANTVVAVAGHCQHDFVVERVGRALSSHPHGQRMRWTDAQDDQRAPRLRFLSKNVEQTHLALGIRGFSRHDDRRFAAKLLSVILGENMSSRLFQVIREQHGLAYSIQSAGSYFSDTGAFLVSAGLDTKRLPRALTLILRELKKTTQEPPGVAELKRAKDYAIGQMRLGLESTSNQMLWIGEHLMAYGFIPAPDEIERRLETVTAADVKAVASALFRNRGLNVALITPRKDEAVVRDLLTFA
ncbi:MAG: insulinase family protein [Verrucomicrobia bacterium]|nr:insulinase family protein [Verrucomicrobiota bacterium]